MQTIYNIVFPDHMYLYIDKKLKQYKTGFSIDRKMR